MHGVTYLVVIHLVFTFSYFNVVCFHVCHRLGTGWLSTSHGSCWPLPDVVPVLCHVSCTHALWFLHGKEALLCMWCECFYCYQFCRKMDLAYWKLILSAWHPIRWRLTNISLKPLHVVFLQLNLCYSIFIKSTYTTHNKLGILGKGQP